MDSGLVAPSSGWGRSLMGGVCEKGRYVSQAWQGRLNVARCAPGVGIAKCALRIA